MKTAPSKVGKEAMKPLLLRPCLLSEESAILSLMREAIAHQGPQSYGHEAVERWLSPSNTDFVFRVPTQCYVAENNGMILGASGWVEEDQADLARITACYTKPSFMGHGLGRLMLSHTVREAHWAGKPRIYLRATQNAAPFYEKCGLKTKGVHRFPIGQGEMLEGPEMWVEHPMDHNPEDHFWVRTVQDTDADQLITLIKGCFEEYEGVYLDLDNDDAILKSMRKGFEDAGGMAWVLERFGEILGCVGWAPSGTSVGLKKLYLRKDVRGRGYAHILTQLVVDAAKRQGVSRVELWSDVKFERGHSFYRKFGFTQTKETRALHDISNTREFRFVMNVEG